MLTSSASQYLQPDYLQPLPTTLDAKKSPLALLAQTCSSIGKDSGTAKSIIPPIEKKDKDKEKSDTPGSKSGSLDDKGRSSTNGSDKRDGATPSSSRGDSPKGGFRAPAPKEIPPLVPISSSNDKTSSSSSSERTTPKASTSSNSDRESTSVTSALPHSVSSTSASSVGANSNSRISLSCGNMLLEVNHQESAAKALGHPTLPGSLKTDGLATPSALHAGLGAYSSLPFFGHPIPMDVATSMYSSLSGHSIAGLTASGHKGMSPYVSYARVKTSSGATTLVPVCKDPYCTHCQMTMQNAQLTTPCGAGCTQCTHDKSLSVPTSLAAHSALGGLPLLPNSASLSLSSLYPHAFGVLPGHSGLPYVCNWVSGSDYCGKRFTTSEELLQHLRTHTSSSEAAAAALSHAGLPYSALAPGLAGCHSHFPAPGSLSPTALRQAYPRSLSPNTLLAASRFHPYKSPLSALPSPASGLSTSGLPSLGAYYSPYSLYGQRIGAVAP